MRKLLRSSILILALILFLEPALLAQKKQTQKPAASSQPTVDLESYFKPVHWRNLGHSRGGRSVGATGVKGNTLTYYMGITGGGVWKTEDAGQTWRNISDGYFKTGSVGAVAVAESDPNVVYVGMGEHAPRGVMTSYGDGVYRSNDAGKTPVKNNGDAIASTKTSSKNSKVGNVEGGLTSTTDNRPYSALETTEEGREASILFENNRGNLPWPVDRGNVYIHFGVENIPGTKLNRKSDGIELALPKGSSVKSVANGVVKYTGDINGDLTVFIQHGKYFSTYTHLSSINVSKDQEVRAGTTLGKSGINLDGEGALLFMINNEKGVFFDPESWLKNRR